MIDFTIIGNNFYEYTPARLIEEAKKARLGVQAVLYKDLDFVIKEAGVEILYNGRALQPSKIAILRLAGTPQRQFLVKWFQSQGGRVLNAQTYLRWIYSDKIEQHFQFQKAGLPFVPSINISSVERLTVFNKFPYIVKYNLSSKGRDVRKITSSAEIAALVPKKYKARRLLVQPFLKAGEDLRVVVLGGRAVVTFSQSVYPRIPNIPSFFCCS